MSKLEADIMLLEFKNRLEPQTGSVNLTITVGSCHKPAVLVTTTLLIKTQTDSVGGTELYRVVL